MLCDLGAKAYKNVSLWQNLVNIVKIRDVQVLTLGVEIKSEEKC